jgi:exopolyphosphatase/guanosine-5'-triphosphate,3'-diphosphate pyrophosphatase
MQRRRPTAQAESASVRVGVIDIGSNTARLLVARIDGDLVEPLEQAKDFLRLGAEIERRGTLRRRTVARAAASAASFAARAEEHGVERTEVLITAPGRQDEAPEALVRAVAGATGWPARVLSHREEGSLAFEGAVACSPGAPDVVGVVDVGGGSTEIAVGTPSLGAAWVHSLDLGSLRLTRRCLPDVAPTPAQVEHARSLVRRSLRDVAAPRPDAVFAVGGTARAVGRAIGSPFGPDELEDLVRAFTGRSAAKAARTFDVDADRAVTVLGGALLLQAAAELLGRELHVGRGGLREGAALALAHRPVVAAHAA